MPVLMAGQEGKRRMQTVYEKMQRPAVVKSDQFIWEASAGHSSHVVGDKACRAHGGNEVLRGEEKPAGRLDTGMSTKEKKAD